MNKNELGRRLCACLRDAQQKKNDCLSRASIRVCIVKGPGVIAPRIMDAYDRAFRLLGANTSVLEIGPQGADAGSARAQLAALKPHLAFCYGYTGLALRDPLRAAGVPLALLFFDSPFGVAWNQYREYLRELAAFPDHYCCFVWDRAYLEALRKQGLRHVFPIMLAADTSVFKPRTPVYRFNVSFAGRMGGLEELRAYRLRTASAHVNEFVDRLIERKVSSPGRPMLHLWAELANESFPDLAPDWNRPGIGELHLHIHREGSILLRRSLLASIRSAGLDLFGADWDLPGAAVHDSLDYVGGLPALYADSRINLNISAPQLEYSVNNRVFDVAAAGGFLLTDYREDLGLVFPDFARITYEDGRELDSKIAHYLVNPEERLRLAADMHDRVLTHHTYEDRVLLILQTLTESGWLA